MRVSVVGKERGETVDLLVEGRKLKYNSYKNMRNLVITVDEFDKTDEIYCITVIFLESIKKNNID